MRNPEIFAHIAAPSGARDDARYRAQAAALLDFQPVSRHVIFGSRNRPARDSLAREGDNSSPDRSEEEDGLMNSGDGLTSVRDECHCSPGSYLEEAAPQSSYREGDTRQGVGSISSISIPLSKTPATCSLCSGPALNTGINLGQVLHPIPEGRSHTTFADKDFPVSNSVVQRRHSESSSLGTPLSVIPDSQPPQSSGPNNGTQSADSASGEVIQVPRSFGADFSPPLERRRLDVAENTKHASEVDDVIIVSSWLSPHGATHGGNIEKEDDRAQTIRSPSLIHQTSRPQGPKRHTLPQPSRPISLFSLPMELHPPSPLLSTEPFKTHITLTLENLAKRMHLSRRFQPANRTRELEPLERGYWFLKVTVYEDETDVDTEQSNKHIQLEKLQSRDGRNGCAPSGPGLTSYNVRDKCRTPSDWSFDFFCRFWSFLTEFILEGRAGWGVWCLLEDEDPDRTESEVSGVYSSPRTSPNQHQDQDVPQQQNRKKVRPIPLTLKVYCWGEVVPYIYGVLYLATERRIREMDAQWRDGADNVVIEMARQTFEC